MNLTKKNWGGDSDKRGTLEMIDIAPKTLVITLKIRNAAKSVSALHEFAASFSIVRKSGDDRWKKCHLDPVMMLVTRVATVKYIILCLTIWLEYQVNDDVFENTFKYMYLV